jgi:response regulator of citrate/malate metabolism
MARAMAGDRSLYSRCKTEKTSCINACPPADDKTLEAIQDSVNELKKTLADNIEAGLFDHLIKPNTANNGQDESHNVEAGLLDHLIKPNTANNGQDEL